MIEVYIMRSTEIMDGVHLLMMEDVNSLLIESKEYLVLIDAGCPGMEHHVFDKIFKLGRTLDDLKHLVFTHCHPDHIGSAAALVRATGAQTYMHKADVPHAESGGPFRPMVSISGLGERVGLPIKWNPDQYVEPIYIDHHLVDDDILPLAGGLRVIHSPGHCAGQIALLGKNGRLLVVGDVCTNIFGLGGPKWFENEAEGRRSQRKLATLDFEVAAFGHGNAIIQNASARFKRTFGPR
jgi:glyoxylase-like metal-dependent hydrolase (beta-lactamase superfamily II)